MEFQDWIARFGIPFGTLAVGLVSGFIPILNVELFLVFVSALPMAQNPFLLAGLAAVGQMIAKSVTFWAAAGVTPERLIPKGSQHRVARLRQKLLDHPKSIDLVLAASSLFGVPPFFILTLAAGSLGIRFSRFLFWGSFGLFTRYLLVALVPDFLRRIGMLSAST